MNRIWLVTYEIPKNQYKHILTTGAYSYTAFRTDKGLAEDLEQIILIVKSLNEGGGA